MRVETKKEEEAKKTAEMSKAKGESFGGFKKGFFNSGPSKPK